MDVIHPDESQAGARVAKSTDRICSLLFSLTFGQF